MPGFGQFDEVQRNGCEALTFCQATDILSGGDEAVFEKEGLKNSSTLDR